MEPITSFKGEYEFLSNFYPAEVKLHDYPYVFPTVEHAYQAAKTTDWAERDLFRRATITDNGLEKVMTAAQAKKTGKQVTLRYDWEKVKLIVMGHLIWQKFEIPELKQKLLDTGYADLIEGNWWGDKFWGVCRGEGLNHLGKLLMKKRAQLQMESFYE